MGSRVHEECMRRSQRVQQFARPARQAGSTAQSVGTRVGRQLTRTAAGEVACWASLSHCGRGAAAHVGVRRVDLLHWPPADGYAVLACGEEATGIVKER